MNKFHSRSASKIFFFSKFLTTLSFWASSREPVAPLYRVKSTLGADLKDGFFLWLIQFTNARILKFLGFVHYTKVFFWNFGNLNLSVKLIKSEIYKSILLWSILFLNCALLNRFITLELLMMWRPPKVCSNVILHLHSQILDILCFKSFLDKNSFSKVHEEKHPKAICPKW